jgi:hypothetical protein
VAPQLSADRADPTSLVVENAMVVYGPRLKIPPEYGKPKARSK